MTEQKRFYEVKAWVPVTAWEHRFPAEYKNFEDYVRYVQEGKFGYDKKAITVVATSPQEAEDKVLARLEEVFGDLPKAKEYWKFARGINHKGPIRGLGIAYKWNNTQKDIRKAERVKYFDFNNIEEPVFVMDHWTNLGIALSFNEMYKMVEEKTLPERFKQFPDLIPTIIYRPYSAHATPPFLNPDDPSKYKRIVYTGKELTPEVQEKIIQGLLNHEEENARGFKLTRNLLKKIKARELFPEETHFWAYHPLAVNFKVNTNCRFHKITYFWKEDYLFAQHLIMGNLSRLEEYIRKDAQREIKKCAKDIRHYSNYSEKIIKQLRNWPKK